MCRVVEWCYWVSSARVGSEGASTRAHLFQQFTAFLFQFDHFAIRGCGGGRVQSAQPSEEGFRSARPLRQSFGEKVVGEGWVGDGG